MKRLALLTTLLLTLLGGLYLMVAPPTTQAQGTGTFAYIANQSSNNVSVLDTLSNKIVATITVGTWPQGVAVNQTGTRVYVANAGGNGGIQGVSVIDPSNNNVVATVMMSNPLGVAVNPAGTRVYATNYAYSYVSVIDTIANSVVATITVGSGPWGVVINPAGTRVYVANKLSNTVSAIDTNTNNVIATVPVGELPWGIAINPAGTRVYVTNSRSNSNSVSVIDTNTNSVIATIPVQSIPIGVTVNPAGTRVYVANRDSNTVSVIDTSTHSVVATVPVGSGPYALTVNPDNTRIYVTNANSHTVSIIDPSTNSVVATVTVGNTPHGVAIRPMVKTTSCYVRVNNGTTDYTTVQTAIDAAANGDTIKVAGTCKGSPVAFITKAITLQGGYTTTNWITPDYVANPTTLDAQHLDRVIRISGDISPIIEGLTIINGGGDAGGGIAVTTAHPTIANVIISNNVSLKGQGKGGGIYLENANRTKILNTVIQNNTAITDGGGIYSINSHQLLLQNVNVVSNIAYHYGGGSMNYNTDGSTIENVLIGNNTSLDDIGGFSLWGKNAVFSNVTVINNSSRTDHAGLFVTGTHLSLYQVNIISNTAEKGINGGLFVSGQNNLLDSLMVQGNKSLPNSSTYGNGGGIYFRFFYTSTLRNSIIKNNYAGGDGGGIYVESGGYYIFENNLIVNNNIGGGSPPHVGSGAVIRGMNGQLIHNTFANNSGGAGQALSFNGSHQLKNSIIANHVLALEVQQTGSVTVDRNIIYNSGTPFSVGAVTLGTNRTDCDPQFVNSSGQDYHLMNTSCAIDYGTDLGLTTDLAGNPRLQGSAPDAGAYEFVGSFSCTSVTEIPQAECNELVTLYNSTGGANWKNKTGWLTTNTPCSWFGLTCSAGQVSEIILNDDLNTTDNIYGNNLSGTIPNLNLSKLEQLYLNNNKLTGTIPNFTHLSNLTRLYLYSNQLSGTIPNFTNLPNLIGLGLENNQLSGTIPNFTNLPNLLWLSVDDNQLSGSIPNFTNLPKLMGLWLYENQLTGVIPNFSNLPKLQKLNLSSNQLSGTIPSLNWASFSELYLNNNCGLAAFDAAQATVLSSKDPNWQVRNPNCGTVTPTPTPNVGDTYEADNTCPEAKAITTDGVPQEHSFHVQADEDWVVFEATQGMTYTIEGRVPPTSRADLRVEVWGECKQAVDNQHLPFAADAQLQIVAPFSGKIYLHLLDENPTNFGTTVNYYLSVRAWETPPQHGAVIIVAGRYRQNDQLQANIEQVTTEVYRLFLQKGHPKERIHYLSTHSNADVDGDFKPDVDGLPSQLNLQNAITSWARDKVGPNQALTLFMMDHGNYDKFYLDWPRNQLLKPADLDAWLTELETATNIKVNVIIEACQSGSFIDQLEDPAQTIRRDGRMIIAATGAYPPSYATQNGAVFSDAFLSALAQDQDLRAAFDDGRWAAESLPKSKTLQGYQTPWLNGDDNSIPNQPSDFQVAAQRGFGITGSFPGDEVWPPYIAQAEIRNWNGQTGQIWAKVLDDLPENNTVWAVLYPPSYQPPTDPTEIVPEPSRLTLLRGAQVVNGWEYSSNWLFNEAGSYQLVIYAKDDDGLLSRPSVITLSTAKRVYLPLIVK